MECDSASKQNLQRKGVETEKKWEEKGKRRDERMALWALMSRQTDGCLSQFPVNGTKRGNDLLHIREPALYIPEDPMLWGSEVKPGVD